MARGLRVVLLVYALTVPLYAIGQAGNRDYYTANQIQEDGQALRNAEQFHIGPGVERMKGNNFGGALEDFTFILQVFPNHPKALELLSELCDVKWRSAKCQTDQWFERAIERNPGASQTYVVNGLHLQRLHRLPEAVESYKKGIALNPGSLNAHYNLALAYLAQKQFDLANREAQISYSLGLQLPGLKDMLTRAGKWKPLDADQLKQQAEPGPNASAPRATQ